MAIFSGYSRIHLCHGRGLVKARAQRRQAPLFHSVIRGNNDPIFIFGTKRCRAKALGTRTLISKGVITARDIDAPKGTSHLIISVGASNVIPITSNSSVVPICFGIYSGGNSLVCGSKRRVQVRISNRKILIKSAVDHVNVGPRGIRNNINFTFIHAAGGTNGVAIGTATRNLFTNRTRVDAGPFRKGSLPSKGRTLFAKGRRSGIIMGPSS